eukprot:TRINITY_DN4983_c0_g1_i1.p1 TRINITY_DN4983_c0_g1~~TRINITY_DN4983_c0_g1_i1.p1  ORF type:complete len:391 (-),score=118.94 TRINITY_DN4983_c0_g1_i1:382-1512(-)
MSSEGLPAAPGAGGSNPNQPPPPPTGAFKNLNLSALDNDNDDDTEDEIYEGEDGDRVVVPHSVLRRINALRDLQGKRDDIYEEYKAARRVLEAEYRKRYDVLYQERCGIVSGNKEVETESEAGDDEEEHGGEGEDIKGVPSFWANAMIRHEALQDLIEEPDVAALAHLTDVKCIDREDLMGFKLEFHFSPNEFFTNSVLTKTYDVAQILDQGEPLLQKVEGCPIDWKKNKNLCEKTVVHKKGRARKGGAAQKPVTRVIKTDSFFKFFLNPIIDSMDDEEDEEEEEHYELNYEVDYEVAQVLRTQIIPNAIDWYTGDAISHDGEDEYDDEEEEEEAMHRAIAAAERDIGADNDDDDDEGADAANAEPNAENPECKQS